MDRAELGVSHLIPEPLESKRRPQGEHCRQQSPKQRAFSQPQEIGGQQIPHPATYFKSFRLNSAAPAPVNTAHTANPNPISRAGSVKVSMVYWRDCPVGSRS